MRGRTWARSVMVVLVACLGLNGAVMASESPSAAPASGTPRVPAKAPTRSPTSKSPNLGFIAPELDLSHLGKQAARKFSLQDTLPSRLDWREQGKVAPVRNQGGCGSCYAFGAIGNLESKLLMDGAGTFNLSENSAKECNWEELNDYHSGVYYWGSCSGGNYEMVTNLLTQRGAALESCDPYVASDVICNTGCIPSKTLLGWNMISDGWVPEPSLLKSYIQAYGPVYATLYASFPDFGPYDGSYTMHYTGTQSPNHAVLIVGWDDSLTHAGGQGGWIVKNSWGSNWGGTCGYGSERGYFTIAYGSASIGMFSSYAAQWQDYDAGGGLMYYDEAGGWRGAYGYGTTGWGLARFTPTRNTYVSRVEFWTTDVTTDVDIYIYDTFDGSAVSTLRWSLLDQSFAEAGYHSVQVQPALPVYGGNDVAVVVKFTNNSYTYPIPVDPVGATQAGATYMSFSGGAGTWYDMQGNDVGIRLRTSDSAGGSTATPSATATATRTATRTPTATATAVPATATPTSTTTATATSVPPTATPEGVETTVILQQGSGGYTGAEDTYMDQYSAGDNYANADSIRVGNKQTRAALLIFDLSSIPPGATVSSSVLQVYATGWGGKNISFGAYGVVRDCVVGQTTWNQARSGQPWGLPGCNDTLTDRRDTAESVLTTNGVYQWYSLDVTQLVSDWINGVAGNYGVLLRQTASTSNAFVFASGEKADSSLRPKLIVTYTAAGAPGPTATCTSTPTGVPPTATATSAPPTATATSTSTPTATAVPATATATSTATATATAVTATATSTPEAAETTVVLQQGQGGYAGAEDTYMDQYNAGANYSGADAFKVGNKQTRAALLSFDVSSIPAGASVASATLEVYAAGWSGSNVSLGAYAVLRQAEPGQATWNQASSGQAWGLPGCNDTLTDRSGTPVSSLTTSGVFRWYNFDVRDLVQGWVDGTLANRGVLLRQTLSASASFTFAAAEKADASLRPRLTVTYKGGGAPIPTPTMTRTPTATFVVVPTATATATSTTTAVPTNTLTSTPASTATPTNTATVVPTHTATATATTTLVPTATPTSSGMEVTVTLQEGGDGYTGAEDTYMDQYNPAVNYSTVDSFRVGYKRQSAGLLEFDVSSIPRSATVVSAHLQVYASGWGGGDISIGVYAILRHMVAAQATWNQASSGQSWGLAGCNDTLTDRCDTAASTLTTGGINKWYSFDITALTQQWVNGGLDNNGVLLAQTTTAAYRFVFAAAEKAEASVRPKLVITYR